MSEESNLTTWVKPSGVELELNDQPATIAAAKANKWKPKKKEVKKVETANK